MEPVVVIEDGLVYTGFKPLRRVNGLVALFGRIVYAGGRDEAWRQASILAKALGTEAASISLGGATAVPGFVDAHLHFGSLGLSSKGLDLHDASSVEELAEKLRAYARTSSLPWIIGRGWDQERLGRWPTRWDIDRVVGDRPVVLVRVCGHAAVLNTLALRELGVHDCTDLVQCRDGTPTGVVFEDLVYRALAAAKKSIGAEPLLEEAQSILLSQGVTLAGDMGTDSFWLNGLLSLYARGKLVIRLRLYLAHDLFNELHDKGVAGPLGDDVLAIRGVKLFADGSLGARTARLSSPYSDDPGNRGKLLMDHKSIREAALRAARRGLDVAVHAIGDEALDHAIKGLVEAGVRGRIEHASVARDDQLDMMAQHGLRVAVQPGFIASDWWIPQRLGPDRARLVYRFRSMVLRGITVGFSSDAPVEPARPLLTVYYAVARPGLSRYNREERLDLETAMYLHTRGAARVLGEERAGCLWPGCYADLTVLERDPFDARIDDLPSLRVEAVIIGGRRVYP